MTFRNLNSKEEIETLRRLIATKDEEFRDLHKNLEDLKKHQITLMEELERIAKSNEELIKEKEAELRIVNTTNYLKEKIKKLEDFINNMQKEQEAEEKEIGEEINMKDQQIESLKAELEAAKKPIKLPPISEIFSIPARSNPSAFFGPKRKLTDLSQLTIDELRTIFENHDYNLKATADYLSISTKNLRDYMNRHNFMTDVTTDVVPRLDRGT